MFITALFVMAKHWKQHRCPSVSERLNKLGHIHTMEHYAAIKKNEVMINAITWISLQGIILSEKTVPKGFLM